MSQTHTTDETPLYNQQMLGSSRHSESGRAEMVIILKSESNK